LARTITLCIPCLRIRGHPVYITLIFIILTVFYIFFSFKIVCKSPNTFIFFFSISSFSLYRSNFSLLYFKFYFLQHKVFFLLISLSFIFSILSSKNFFFTFTSSIDGFFFFAYKMNHWNMKVFLSCCRNSVLVLGIRFQCFAIAIHQHLMYVGLHS